jgi:hypothetical protein
VEAAAFGDAGAVAQPLNNTNEAAAAALNAKVDGKRMSQAP